MGWFESFKIAYQTVQQVHDHQVKSTLLTQLIDLQQISLSQDEEIRRLRDENQSLRQQLHMRANAEELLQAYEHRDNALWKDGKAFCINCLQAGNGPRLLTDTGKCSSNAICPACKQKYFDVYPSRPGRPIVFSARQRRLKGIEGL